MAEHDYRITSEDQIVEILGSPDVNTAAKISDHLDDLSQDFIRTSTLVFVSTVDKDGRLDVSPKGDGPGFCQIADDKTLLLPERPGNKLAFDFRNILQTGRIGMVFLIPGIREVVRVNGSAEITNDPVLLEQLAMYNRPALLCTRITVEECFLHCGRALVRSNVWRSENWPTNVPDVSYGRLYRSMAIKAGSPDAEAAQIKDQTNEQAEIVYKNELY